MIPGKEGLSSFREYCYYGIGLAGVEYRIGKTQFSQQLGNTIYTYYYENDLTNKNGFAFKVPEGKKIFYVGMKNDEGNEATEFHKKTDVDDLKLKQRIAALDKLKKKYKGTEWEEVIFEELQMLGAAD